MSKMRQLASIPKFSDNVKAEMLPSRKIFFSQKNQEKNMPLSYIPAFCNFYSYLLIFPFKLVWCDISARFILQTATSRKIICYFTHTIAIFATTPYLIGFFRHLMQGWVQPMYLLVGSTNLITYLTTIDFLQIIWKSQEIILETANWHLHNNLVHQIPLYKIGIVCICPLIPILLDNPPAGTFNELIGVPSNNGFSFNTSFFSSDDNILGPAYLPLYIIFLYGHLYHQISTGLALVLTLSIKESLTQLMSSAFDYRDADMALYKEMKIEASIRNLVKMSSEIISRKVLLEYLLMLSFYAIIFEFFKWTYQGSDFHRLHVLFYLLFSGAFWITSCEVHCLVRNYLKEWAYSFRSTYLMRSPETLKQYQTCLLALQSEADLNPPCISCSCFNVTYAFIGSMFGLIITYSTIVYQMKTEKIEKSQHS